MGPELLSVDEDMHKSLDEFELFAKSHLRLRSNLPLSV